MSKKIQALKATTFAIVAASAILTGCATQPKPVAPEANAELMTKLATYADRASRSMQRLASVRGANAGVNVDNVQIPAGLEVPISIKWSGPVDQLAAKVAQLTGYQFGGVLGNSKTPVLVSITVVNTPAFNVLADAGAQAGSAAEIVVHPNTKKIFVKYPPAARTGGYPMVAP